MNTGGGPQRELTLLDSTSLIVGIIIGAGIYQMAPDIAKGAGSAWGVLGIWALGGLLSLCGALCYAELATAYQWTPLLFAAVCLLLIRSAIIYRPWIAMSACGLLLLGLPFWWLSNRMKT
jgi:amino acid permease